MADDVENLNRLADTHWWSLARRRLIGRHAAKLRSLNAADPAARPIALDIGAGAGQNTEELWQAGWCGVAIEPDAAGARVISRRGVPVLRADATALPIAECSVNLVISADVLEHLPDDRAAAREMFRVLRPGGTALVAVPAHPELWSAHDVAVNHQRRYRRPELIAVLREAGFGVAEHEVWSWNILLYPLVRAVRAVSRRPVEPGSGADNVERSDLEPVNPVVNAALRAVLWCESLLPHCLKIRLPGVSLVVLARRPA